MIEKTIFAKCCSKFRAKKNGVKNYFIDLDKVILGVMVYFLFGLVWAAAVAGRHSVGRTVTQVVKVI